MARPSGLIGPQGLTFLAEVVGAENVSVGESVLDLHGRDSSYHPAVRPEAVAWPTTTAQVSQILAWADREAVPVTPWGAGTSLEGNPIPVARGLVLDMTRMNRILELREEDMQVDVEPGVGYKDLNHSLRHKGLFFPPDPGAWATIGGMIANNASGVRTVKYGCTRDYVQALEVVLPGGEVIVTGTKARKSSAGYYLTGLFVGSEGTLGVVTRATLRLAGLPEHFLAAVAAFDSVERATEAVAMVIRAGLGPAALELVTAPLVKVLNRADNLGLPEKDILFMEFTSFSTAGLAELLGLVKEICQELGCLSFDSGLGRDERDRLWAARHALAETVKRAHPGLEMLVTDAAVPVSRFPELITFCRDLIAREGHLGYILGHAGDGNLHLDWMGDPADRAAWARLEAANQAVVEKAIAMGGSATGEHGVGLGKKKFMALQHGPALGLMRRIKAAIDPHGIMNPGKVLP